MAKLYGTADQGLVQGQLNVAAAKTSGDVQSITPMLEQTAKQSQQFQKAIGDVVKAYGNKKYKEDLYKANQMGDFASKAKQTYKKLYEQDEPLPQKVIDAVDRAVTKLQEDYEKVNATSKDDTKEKERERMRIMGELKRITNQAVNARANLMTIGTTAGNFNSDLIDPADIDPMKSVIDIENMDKNEGVTVDFIDGKLTFSTKNYTARKGTYDEYVDSVMGGEVTGSGLNIIGEDEWNMGTGELVSFTTDQMLAKLPQKKKENDKMVINIMSDAQGSGKIDNSAGNPNFWRNTDGSINEFVVKDKIASFVNPIQTKEDFMDFTRKMDGVSLEGFKIGLRSNMDIPISLLENMSYEDDEGNTIDLGSVFAAMDTAGGEDGGDGKITAADLVNLEGKEKTSFEANMDLIIKVLTDARHPAFDLETSKQELGKYYVKHEMDNYEHYYYKGKTRPGEETEDFPAETTSNGAIDTSNYEDETPEAEGETPETPEEKPAGPIAQQMLDEKYPSGKDVFNIDELRSTLASGGVSEEILTKYLSEIPGVTIGDGVAKGLDQKGFKFSTAFNKAMRKLQNEENINLGY